MEVFKNIKKEHYLFTFLFLVSFITFIFFHYHFKEGIFFDQPAMFFTAISPLDEDLNGYILVFDNRIRFFNNFLVSVPLNILIYIYNTVKHDVNLLNYVCLFTSSYFFVHLFALLVNFLVAIRTKRYDIAIIGFAFYTFFCLTNLIWAVREIHITVLFYFPLLSYFLSKEKLYSKDFIPVLLLIIYMFESFEINIFLGFILQLFACLYTIIRIDKNIAYKNIIGSCCFLASIYIVLKLYFWLPDAVEGGIEQYLFGIIFYTKNVLYTGGIITLAGLIPLFVICFYKRRLSVISVIPFFILITATVFVMWRYNMFVPDAPTEINAYGWTIVLIFPVILAILFCDLLKLDITKITPDFYSNLYLVACIVGISQLIWQIHSCFLFNDYVSYIRNLIKTSEERIIEIPQQDYENNHFLRFYNGYGIIHQSVLLNPTKDVEKIVVPLTFQSLELNWDTPGRTTIRDNGINILHDVMYSDKHSKYLNVKPIVKYVQETRQQNSD
jgi:hypothetical protein